MNVHPIPPRSEPSCPKIEFAPDLALENFDSDRYSTAYA